MHNMRSVASYRSHENCFIEITVHSMMCKNNVHHGLMAVFVCLYIIQSRNHQYADSCESNELTKRLSGIICRVCVLDYVHSLSYLLCNIWGLVFAIYLCIFS